MSGVLFALAALVPAMLGSVPLPARTLVITLCQGEQMSFPLSGQSDEQGQCAQKGCHAGCSRKRFDRSQ